MLLSRNCFCVKNIPQLYVTGWKKNYFFTAPSLFSTSRYIFCCRSVAGWLNNLLFYGSYLWKIVKMCGLWLCGWKKKKSKKKSYAVSKFPIFSLSLIVLHFFFLLLLKPFGMNCRAEQPNEKKNVRERGSLES